MKKNETMRVMSEEDVEKMLKRHQKYLEFKNYNGKAIFWGDLTKHPNLFKRKDLSYAGFADTRVAHMELRHMELKKAMFTQADMHGTTFVCCDLRYAMFDSANLRRATFIDCDLRGASFSGANLDWASFSCGCKFSYDVDCSSEELQPSDMHKDNTKFNGASLVEADFSDCNLIGCHFNGADMDGISMKFADISCCEFPGVDARHGNFMSIRGINLNAGYGDFSHANFVTADLESANFSSAKLYDTSFKSAYLENVHLGEASLLNTDFSHAEGMVSQIDFLKENFQFTEEGMIVYKSFGEVYDIPAKWGEIEQGAIIEENVNFDRTVECACGVNVATARWAYIICDRQVWECLIKHEWLSGVCVPYEADGKIRAEKVQLLKPVNNLYLSDKMHFMNNLK